MIYYPLCTLSVFVYNAIYSFAMLTDASHLVRKSGRICIPLIRHRFLHCDIFAISIMLTVHVLTVSSLP